MDKLKKYMEIADDTYFWRLSSGDHLNMLDSAIEEIEHLREENAKLQEALENIEAFGHSAGHGRGYTCGNMAATALATQEKE
jgi:hypothetical protein